MLKAKVRGPDGPLYVFGLSAENVKRLLQGDPIAFDGREVAAPPGQRFLIAWAETEADIRRQHDHFAVPGLHTHTIGMSRAVLKGLAHEPARMPGARMKLDGDVLIFAGDTEAAMGEALLGIRMPETKSGYRDELDPLTGAMRRIRVEQS